MDNETLEYLGDAVINYITRCAFTIISFKNIDVDN